MAHGLSGTRRDRLGPFAERFAAAGLRGARLRPPRLRRQRRRAGPLRPARQLEDWRAAIAFARSLPGVDPERVATFGSSMGGGNALAAAADDRRVAAAISQVPVPRHRRARPTAPRRASPRGCCWRRSRGRHLPAVGQPRRGGASSTRPAARRAGATSSRSARTRAGATASPRAGCSAAPTAPAATRPRCTARGSSASARPTGSPARARRSPPRGARRWASCAPTPASTTSTSTTAPRTRRVVADQLDFLRRHLLEARGA